MAAVRAGSLAWQAPSQIRPIAPSGSSCGLTAVVHPPPHSRYGRAAAAAAASATTALLVATRAARRRKSVETVALQAQGDGSPPPREGPPQSTEVMCRQAAESVMRAYKDGYTRQTVRLRLDAALTEDQMYSSGIQAVLKATLPIAKSFTRKLWGGQSCKQIKASIIDGEVGTLLYREAENPAMDAAVMYLPGRDLVTDDRTLQFFEGMGDRLVVLSNTEQATATWKVENMGRDFLLQADGDKGLQVSRMFQMQSYYYYQCPINNWQIIYFRSYPYPWEVYIEDLNYNLVKIGESPEKPSYDELFQWMLDYEAANDVKVYQKVGKYLKDQQGPGDVPNPLML